MKDTVKKMLPSCALELGKYIYYPAMLAMHRFANEPEMGGVRRLVRKGDVVVDVGANLGAYTHLLSGLVGRRGRVYAFEPVPRTYSLLKWGVHVLGRRNVELSMKAVSDKVGSGSMRIPMFQNTGKRNYFMASLVDGGNSATGDGVVTIATTTLAAEFAKNRESISFVKCDVEGHELSVIRGCADLLEVCRPALLIEIGGDLGNADSDAGKLQAALTDLGYLPYVFDSGEFRRCERDERHVNYFFLSDDHLRRCLPHK